MSNQRLGLRVAGLIFALFALFHVLRIAEQLEVMIGGRVIPMWPSILAAAVGAALSVWLLVLARSGPKS